MKYGLEIANVPMCNEFGEWSVEEPWCPRCANGVGGISHLINKNFREGVGRLLAEGHREMWAHYLGDKDEIECLRCGKVYANGIELFNEIVNKLLAEGVVTFDKFSKLIQLKGGFKK